MIHKFFKPALSIHLSLSLPSFLPLLSSQSAATTASYTWARRWFVLEGSSLYYVRENAGDMLGEVVEGSERSLVCDVVLSSVREVPSGDNSSSSSSSHNNHGSSSSSANDPNAPPALPYCLEIFSANRKSFVLQAEGSTEYHAWLQALRRRIERLLVGGEGVNLPSRGRSAPSSPERVRSLSPTNLLRSTLTFSPRRVVMSGFGLRESYLGGGGGGGGREGERSPRRGFGGGGSPRGEGGEGGGFASQDKEDYPPKIMEDRDLRKLVENNPRCADCEAPHPDWVSLNLGVVICLQCSGVHRSLGVHVSKVRSLALDQMDETDLAVLAKLGNASVNRVYEHKLLDGWQKPSPDEPRLKREQFVKAKYVWKGFTPLMNGEKGALKREGEGDRVAEGGSGNYGQAQQVQLASQALVDAVLCNDLGAALAALVQGADIHWTGGNGNEKRQTALHLAAQSGDAVVEAVAFLVQNGANVSVRDGEDLTALDLATKGHHAQTVRYLLKF